MTEFLASSSVLFGLGCGFSAFAILAGGRRMPLFLATGFAIVITASILAAAYAIPAATFLVTSLGSAVFFTTVAIVFTAAVARRPANRLELIPRVRRIPAQRARPVTIE